MHTYEFHVDEVIAWGWIAATVLFVLVLAAMLSIGTEPSPFPHTFDLAVPAMEQTAILSHGA